MTTPRGHYCPASTKVRMSALLRDRIHSFARSNTHRAWSAGTHSRPPLRGSHRLRARAPSSREDDEPSPHLAGHLEGVPPHMARTTYQPPEARCGVDASIQSARRPCDVSACALCGRCLSTSPSEGSSLLSSKVRVDRCIFDVRMDRITLQRTHGLTDKPDCEPWPAAVSTDESADASNRSQPDFIRNGCHSHGPAASLFPRVPRLASAASRLGLAGLCS